MVLDINEPMRIDKPESKSQSKVPAQNPNMEKDFGLWAVSKFSFKFTLQNIGCNTYTMYVTYISDLTYMCPVTYVCIFPAQP